MGPLDQRGLERSRPRSEQDDVARGHRCLRIAIDDPHAIAHLHRIECRDEQSVHRRVRHGRDKAQFRTPLHEPGNRRREIRAQPCHFAISTSRQQSDVSARRI
jgi:hypothetical protein